MFKLISTKSILISSYAVRHFSVLPPGIGDMLKNPATIAAAKKFMQDPASMSKIQEMMKDKATVERMMGMLSDPAFRSQVEALRKETNMPGADIPITDDLVDQYKKAMGIPAPVVDAKGKTTIEAESTPIPGKSVADVAKAAAASPTSAKANTSGKSNSDFPAVVELREYTLQPYMAGQYMKATNEAANLRKSLVPLRLFSLPDTGGALNVATHLYYYGGGLPERDAKRREASLNSDWQDYLAAARPCMLNQKSQLYCEAPLPSSMMTGMRSLSPALVGGSDPIYEYRRYQLKLGYDAVPRFLDHFQRGLPSRLQHKHASTELLTVMYSEVGDLNEVIELWRHGDGNEAMHATRVASRGAASWKAAIAGISELSVKFTNSVHRPAIFSSWK